MEQAIQIEGLCKTYRHAAQPLMEGLSVSVDKGTFFGLLGPNGAGKTTLLSIVWGLRTFDAGTVTVCGLDVRRQAARIKPLIGVVPQDIALYPELTVDENLRFAGRIYGLPEATLRRRIDSYLTAFGLAEHRHKRTAHLSGGMKRQTNLIAALLHEPQVLFLDEPTVGVDVQSRQVIVQNLQTLHRKGMTIVYTSHDMHEAEQLCTVVALIDRGRIVAQGTPDALIRAAEADSLETLFIRTTGHRPTE